MRFNLHVRILAFFFLMSATTAMPVMADGNDASVKRVEDFSRFEAGTYPEGWKTGWGAKEKARHIYKVRSGEGSYLEAKALNCDVPIAKEFEYDLKEYPFLKWQWRAIELPKGADERCKKTGDSGAAIYVIFPGRFRPDNIKYVWSSSLPIGTTTESPYNSKTKVVVLRNHLSPLGTWISERVNVYEDYKRLFGHEPEPVQAIGIMSDSNNTESSAIAHYKGICVSRQ